MVVNPLELDTDLPITHKLKSIKSFTPNKDFPTVMIHSNSTLNSDMIME